MKKLILVFLLLLSLPAFADYDQGNRTTGGSTTITAADKSVIYSDGANNPTADSAHFYYDKTTHTLYVDIVTTLATNTPQSDYFPTSAGDTHWAAGLFGNGDGVNNDNWVLSEGTVLGSSNRISCAPGGVCTIPSMVVTTINGNTFTTGTGTLTLGAGKTLTVNNTLTFTGTDSSSVAFGTGGTVAYTAGPFVAGSPAIACPESLTSASATFFMAVNGSQCGTETNCNFTQMPYAGTIKNMYAVVGTAPSSGKSWTVTMRKNAVDQAVTASIADANKTANDTTHSFTFSAGDSITVGFTAVGGPTATGQGEGVCFEVDHT